MEKYLKQAVENFFVNTLGFELKKVDSNHLKNIYVSTIQLREKEHIYSFDLCLDEELLKEVSYALFMDKNPNIDMMIDLNCEVANLIIGNLKLLLSEEFGNDIELFTPNYEGYFEYGFSKEFDEKHYYQINDYTFMLGVNLLKESLASQI